MTHATQSRHPFEIFALGLALLVGTGATLLEARPGSVEAELAWWIRDLWGYLLLFGGAMAITGISWRDRVTGLILEQIGLTALAGGCVLYSWAVVAATGFGGLWASGAVILFAWAAMRQWWRIEKALRNAGKRERWLVRRRHEEGHP